MNQPVIKEQQQPFIYGRRKTIIDEDLFLNPEYYYYYYIVQASRRRRRKE
jgi:hypothetical protein